MLQVTKIKIYLIKNDMYAWDKDSLESVPYFYGNCEQLYDEQNGVQAIARIFTDTKWMNGQNVRLGQRVYFKINDKEYNALIQSHKEYPATMKRVHYIFDVV